MWSEGTPSFRQKLERQGLVTHAFDYESVNSVWVGKGDTAQRLAKTIVCYSILYGGKKVVVVAHSMGGLLTRLALDSAAYGKLVRNVVGHVITIGTPHLGALIANPSYIADVAMCTAVFAWQSAEAFETCKQVENSKAVAAMRVGSPELKVLPKFPAGITVKAIAGEVIWKGCAPWGCSAGQSQLSDLVVQIASAIHLYTSTGIGDGVKVFRCDDPLALLQVSKPFCEHNQLPKSDIVQGEVMSSINAYIAWTKRTRATSPMPTRTAPRSPSPSPTSPTTAYEFFGTMTLRLPSSTKVRATGGEGLSSYDVACVDRSACPSFAVYRPNEVGGDLGWRSWQYDRCPTVQGSTNQVIVDKGTRQIGSKTARYYEMQLCIDAQPQIARFWEVTDGTIFVMDVSGNSYWWSTEDAILTASTWR